MDKELETYIKQLETKFNLKSTAESLGFNKKDRDFYVKSDVYKICMLFEEEKVIIWCDINHEKQVMKNYIELYNEIDRGFCTTKEFLRKVLNLLSN